MALPLIPILIAGGVAAVAFALSKKSSASPTNPHGLPPGPGPGPGPGPLDPNATSDIVVSPWGDKMPAVLAQAITLEMQNDKDPNALYRYADALMPDYPMASGQMLTLANALAVDPPVNPPQPVPKPIPVNPRPPQPPPQATVYDPPLPPLKPIPAKYAIKTEQHAVDQRALIKWAQQVGFPRYPAVQLDGKRQDDGIIGPTSQKAFAAFQIWANDNRGAGLTVDGLPGPLTGDHVEMEFGEDVVQIQPVTIVG